MLNKIIKRNQYIHVKSVPLHVNIWLPFSAPPSCHPGSTRQGEESNREPIPNVEYDADEAGRCCWRILPRHSDIFNGDIQDSLGHYTMVTSMKHYFNLPDSDNTEHREGKTSENSQWKLWAETIELRIHFVSNNMTIHIRTLILSLIQASWFVLTTRLLPNHIYSKSHI